MRRSALRFLAIAVTMMLAASAEAAAVPPPPTNLTVGTGEEAWSAVNLFSLHWTNPEPTPPIAAVHYRVLDPLGGVAVPETRIGGVVHSIPYGIRVLHGPGAYTAEVWLEDSAGAQGAPAEAKLRFDDVAPGHAAPIPPETWISRTGIPHTIRFEHPSGDPPVSGIRGYAVSVDTDPQGRPCAGTNSCTDAETDLRAGIGDDSYSIDALPEGVSYVHVVAVSGSGVRSATTGHAQLRVDKTDPVTRLEGARDGWSDRPVAITAHATDTGSGMEGNDPGAHPFTAIRVDGGKPTVAPGNTVEASVIEEGVHRVEHYARDDAGNVNDGAASNGQQNLPPATTPVRIDLSPPTVSFLGSQDPRDPELIEARVRDALSGPSTSRGRIGVRRLGSGDPFESLPTERAGTSLRARWNSDAYPAGEYEFRATGYDEGGNSATSALRSDGTRMVLSNPLKAPTALSAGLLPARRVVPYGRGIRLSGRLRMGLRTPLEGASVQIVERFGEGRDRFERFSTVRTQADGAFSLRLAKGPSREIVALFEGTGTLARSVARPVRLDVRSVVRLRASSATATVGGRPLIFTGCVAAPKRAIPRGGKSVALQFRLPGLPWTEFRTVQTDSRGRFRYAYRFADDDSRDVRFQFRAYVPPESGWHFEPAASKPVSVLGR